MRSQLQGAVPPSLSLLFAPWHQSMIRPPAPAAFTTTQDSFDSTHLHSSKIMQNLFSRGIDCLLRSAGCCCCLQRHPNWRDEQSSDSKVKLNPLAERANAGSHLGQPQKSGALKERSSTCNRQSREGHPRKKTGPGKQYSSCSSELLQKALASLRCRSLCTALVALARC